jgi:hypothetical protein
MAAALGNEIHHRVSGRRFLIPEVPVISERQEVATFSSYPFILFLLACIALASILVNIEGIKQPRSEPEPSRHTG